VNRINEIAFCGYCHDQSLLKASSSGGMARVLIDYYLRNEALVYCAVFANNYHEAKYVRIENVKEKPDIPGSIYFHAKITREIIDAFIEDLGNKKRILIIGLPCDIALFYGICKKENGQSELVLFVDLICHGTIPKTIYDSYLAYIEKRAKASIIKFSFRYKKAGYWLPVYMHAAFENGKVLERQLYLTELGRAYELCLNEGCYYCKYKGDDQRCSDITIGDYRLGNRESEGYNSCGTSLILPHTNKGIEALNCLKGTFVYSRIDKSHAIGSNVSYFESTMETKSRIQFKKNFKESGLLIAVRRSFSLKEYLIWLMPDWVRYSKLLKYILLFRSHFR